MTKLTGAHEEERPQQKKSCIIHPALTKSKNLVLNEVHLECSAKRGISAVEAIEWVFGARLKACPWDSPSIESQQTNPYRAYFIGLNLKGDQPNP